MLFGIQLRATTETADVRAVARALEDRGFDALYVPEHTHIPLSVRSLFPDDPGWLEACKRMFDPFVTLAAAGAVTQRLRLATGVCLLPQHDPIVLAKTVATLDVLTGGRVLLGVGAGWNEPELRHHGVAPADRWRVMREKALALRAIWTSDEAEFHGDFVDFEPIWLWPKPVQRPHPPLIIGGEGPRVLQRVLDYGDEWMPNDHPELEARIDELQRRAAALGRGPIPVTVYATPPERERVEVLRAAGVARCAFNVRARTLAEALQELDQLALLVVG
jgi:probable F420-dependent oxidoreductase